MDKDGDQNRNIDGDTEVQVEIRTEIEAHNGYRECIQIRIGIDVEREG